MAAKKKPFWLGFDLGGTKMLASVFDARFRVLASRRTKTKGQAGTREVLERIKQTIAGALEDAGITPTQLGGIGIGCPGPLDLDKGIVFEAPNLGWKNVRLKQTLQQTFRCPVVLGNDVDMGTYGEYRFGAAKGARCVVGIFPGTGIGGACVYEGKLLRGRIGSCMEIGHMKVQEGGLLCGCGKRGCLETVASRLAISAECAMAAYRGEAPHLLETCGTDLVKIKSGSLAKSVRMGDAAIERIVRDAAAQMGSAVANLVNLLAPDVVVFGGGLVEAMRVLILKEVRAVVRREAMGSFLKGLKIVPAQLGDEATSMGAAAYAANAKPKGKPRR